MEVRDFFIIFAKFDFVRARLFVEGKATQWQAVQVKADACQWQVVQVEAACQWQVVQVEAACQWQVVQFATCPS
jgi:hypothetical protein